MASSPWAHTPYTSQYPWHQHSAVPPAQPPAHPYYHGAPPQSGPAYQYQNAYMYPNAPQYQASQYPSMSPTSPPASQPAPQEAPALSVKYPSSIFEVKVRGKVLYARLPAAKEMQHIRNTLAQAGSPLPSKALPLVVLGARPGRQYVYVQRGTVLRRASMGELDEAVDRVCGDDEHVLNRLARVVLGVVGGGRMAVLTEEGLREEIGSLAWEEEGSGHGAAGLFTAANVMIALELAALDAPARERDVGVTERGGADYYTVVIKQPFFRRRGSVAPTVSFQAFSELVPAAEKVMGHALAQVVWARATEMGLKRPPAREAHLLPPHEEGAASGEGGGMGAVPAVATTERRFESGEQPARGKRVRRT